jgi:hypothetical protein
MRPEQEKNLRVQNFTLVRAANSIRIAICGQNMSIIFVKREYIDAPKFAAHSLLSNSFCYNKRKRKLDLYTKPACSKGK